jgi:hypothetical protein
MRKSLSSKFLAKVFGIYLLVTGLLVLFNLQDFVFNIKNLLNTPSLLFLSGFITLILSILILVAHFKWQWGWPLIITLLGFWLFIKALILLLFPQYLGKIFNPIFSSAVYGYTMGAIILAFASLLLYFGFSKKT